MADTIVSIIYKLHKMFIQYSTKLQAHVLLVHTPPDGAHPVPHLMVHTRAPSHLMVPTPCPTFPVRTGVPDYWLRPSHLPLGLPTYDTLAVMV